MKGKVGVQELWPWQRLQDFDVFGAPCPPRFLPSRVPLDLAAARFYHIMGRALISSTLGDFCGCQGPTDASCSPGNVGRCLFWARFGGLKRLSPFGIYTPKEGHAWGCS